MTEPLLTQAEVEARMYFGGIKRAEASMMNAEEAGRAHTNPYAKGIFDDFVLPVGAVLKQELENTPNASRRHAALSLIEDMDMNAVAFLAVRTVVDQLLQKDQDHRRLGYAIGRTIHSELVLAQIEAHNPELYHTLANDFNRKLSKDERHRMTVFKRSAAKAGIVFEEWTKGARDVVGLYLLGLLEVADLVSIAPANGGHKKYKQRGFTTDYRGVWLSDTVMDRINESKAFTAISMPVFGPTVEPPKDWTNWEDGGFHTPQMRRSHRFLIRAGSTIREYVRATEPSPTVLGAVNTLQRTAWSVNEQVLDTVLRVAAETRGTKEITSTRLDPKPDKPAGLGGVEKEAMNETQAAEFKAWKKQMARWYTDRKLLATRYGRFYSATRAAEMFRAYPSIYFVYFADSRGRLYPMTYGLNPQGSDLQRGLLRFSKGLPLNSPESIRWFHVQGANKWGFDKATLEERQQWVVDRQDQILSMAADPLTDRGWMEAADPVQFLAWAIEYRQYVTSATEDFLSYLPISMDGSCNGLQNLSALLRDEVGGKATNLTNNAVMQDIYQQVADAATTRLRAMRLDDSLLESLRLRWLSHGVSRKVVKRSVMTTPYGVTRSSAEDYVISDYLAEVSSPFSREEWTKASRVLMSAVWPAIGDVVVKGREAMAWLKKGARVVMKSKAKEENPLITWSSPSGFPASQAYWEAEESRVLTRLHGTVKIVVHSESDEASLTKHASGLAPNFVHSMDAAHLHRTTSTAGTRAIDALAMIHDDYGTHAANSQALYEIIREEFVSMYTEHDPIKEFHERYPMMASPPKPGTLDIDEVLQSKYFFS